MALPIQDIESRMPQVGGSLSEWGGKLNAIDQELADGINELYDDILEINGVSSGLATKLDKDGYIGTAQDLKDNIDLKEDKSNKGVANGYVPLNGSTLIDTQYLPSYVGDIVEGYYDSGIFYEDSGHTTPIIGTQGKVYVDITSGKANQYRWSGSAYVFLGTGNLATTTTDGLMSADDKVQVGKYRVYDTVAEMQADSANITVGSIVELLGYYEKGDGGGHKRKKNPIGSTYEWKFISENFYNVKWFGAKGDGTTDDTLSIQNSIDYIKLLKNNITLFFPLGSYKVTSTLEIGYNVNLEGIKKGYKSNQQSLSSILNYSSTSDLLVIGDSLSNPSGGGVEFKNLLLKQATETTDDISLVKIINNRGCSFKNVNMRGNWFLNSQKKGTGFTIENNNPSFCDYIEIKGCEISGFENAIHLNKVSGSQSFAGHSYEFSCEKCTYHIKLSGGANLYHSKIIENQFNLDSNEFLFYLNSGNIWNCLIRMYGEGQGKAVKVSNLPSNAISGDIDIHIGSDGYNEFVTDRSLLKNKNSLISYENMYVSQSYPSSNVQSYNVHSSTRVQFKGFKTQEKLISDNGYISKDYRPDDVISNKYNVPNSLNNIAPTSDTQSLTKLIKGYGLVKATAESSSNQLMFLTSSLFSTYTNNSIPNGTISFRVKRSTPTSPLINRFLINSTNSEGKTHGFRFAETRNYSQASVYLNFTGTGLFTDSPNNWVIPFEREILIFVSWDSTNTYIWWEGFKQTINGAPYFLDYITFGNQGGGISGGSSFASIYDIAIWKQTLPDSIIESFYLEDKMFSVV